MLGLRQHSLVLGILIYILEPLLQLSKEGYSPWLVYKVESYMKYVTARRYSVNDYYYLKSQSLLTSSAVQGQL